jgi:hypothetical protein
MFFKHDIWAYYHTLKSLKLVQNYWLGFYASRFVDSVHVYTLKEDCTSHSTKA